MTPLKQIRACCVACCNNQPGEVRKCPKTNCCLLPYRMGEKTVKAPLLKIIRKKCLDCGEGTWRDIDKCSFLGCPLHLYRHGKNPARKGIGNKDVNKYSKFKKSSLSKGVGGKVGL